MTVVLVTWHDAHSGAESWINIKDLDTEPAEVQSVGFLLATSDGGKPDHVTLYQSRNEVSVDRSPHPSRHGETHQSLDGSTNK